jgi:hypothetical protein
MPRLLVVSLVLACLTSGAVLPEQFGPAKRGDVQPLARPDAALSAELGLDVAEQAEYTAAGPPAVKFVVSAWRLKDPTSALTFFLANRQPGAAASKLEKVSVSEPDGGSFFIRGNYAFRIKGWTPTKPDLDAVFAKLPRLDQSGLPTLPSYLPEGRLANSDRFIIGPVTLERFEGRISPGTAAFSLSAEAATAKYPNGATLTIFNYPTPEIARQRVEEHRKTSGSVVKRAGPMVAVVLGSPDADAAEVLLAKVNYQATLTWNEADPDKEDRRGASTLLSAFVLAGALMLLCVLAGVAFGLIRVAHRKVRKGPEEPAMIRLDLDAR